MPHPALAMSLGAMEVVIAGGVSFGPQKFGVGDIVFLAGVAEAEACVLRGCVQADNDFWFLGEILVKKSGGLACSRWRLQVELELPLRFSLPTVDIRSIFDRRGPKR